jgi:RimJ/RimL family protein N-acetyltransferase
MLPLVTARLLLRDFGEDDLADVCAFRSDPEVARSMLTHEPERAEQTQAWLRDLIAHSRRDPREAYSLAIVRRAEGRVIGQIGIGAGPSADYPAPGEIGVGYMLRRDCWGRGYATEAARAIVDFGFAFLQAQQVSAWCFAANRASARVLEKAGLRLELREAGTEPKRGELVESLKYTIHRHEWLSSETPAAPGPDS